MQGFHVVRIRLHVDFLRKTVLLRYVAIIVVIRVHYLFICKHQKLVYFNIKNFGDLLSQLAKSLKHAKTECSLKSILRINLIYDSNLKRSYPYKLPLHLKLV